MAFKIIQNNSKNSFVEARVYEKTVKVTTLDLEFENKAVNFIKIDIEGGEWPAILGAEKLIKTQNPMLMVEIQADRNNIYQFMKSCNYIGFNEKKNIITHPDKLNGNIFWLNKTKHGDLIEIIGLKAN